jgi:hypothetical protein
MKRRLSVKGTAGTTPAPSKANHVRRESSTFSPPNTRPASRLSDVSKDVPKAGKPSEHSSTTTRVTTLGKSVRINATAITPPGTASTNKIPTPTTVKPVRTVEGSMGPPPARQRASLSTTTSPTGALTQTHTRVTSTSSTLGRPGVKSPTMTNRRPSSMSGTELLRQAKLATSDVEQSTSQQSSSSSASDEKENRVRPPPRVTTSSSAAAKRRSMIAVPT